MHARVRELAVKAGLYVDVNGSPWPRNMNGEDIEGAYQKFAQLIVAECLTLCEHESNDDPHDEYDMGMFVKAGAISDRIKHHFGVEE